MYNRAYQMLTADCELAQRRIGMLKIRSLIALAIAAVLLTLPAVALAQNTSSVTGTINLRQRVTIPNDAVVTIQLADASRQGAPAPVLAQQSFSAKGAQAPF